jgi:hypothetical protein
VTTTKKNTILSKKKPPTKGNENSIFPASSTSFSLQPHLQGQRETGGQTAQREAGTHERPRDLNRAAGRVGLGVAGRRARATGAEAGVDGVGGSRSIGGGGGCTVRGGGGSVDALGVEGTARVVLTAVAGARIVAAAGGDALVAPLLADEVGQGERVLGDVGLEAVAADAAVREGFLRVRVSMSERGRKASEARTKKNLRDRRCWSGC